ncbi:hypothetical protein AFLA_000317 [Aspergillus flavus NRRL3357]|nr:hypothetical protein AFLA_000317 [Aspergillus flavus NRRL3357]
MRRGFYTKHLWFKHQVSAGVITSVARDLSDRGSTSRYLVVEYEPVANHAAEEGSHHYWYNLANRTHLIGCNVVAEEAVDSWRLRGKLQTTASKLCQGGPRFTQVIAG